MTYRPPLVVLGALALASCEQKSAPPKPVEPPLEAEVSGCGAVLAGGVCELSQDRQLRAWAPATAVEATIDGKPATPTSRPVAGGVLLSIPVGAGAKELRLSASAEGALRVRTVRLAEPAAPAWLEQARALRQKGEHARALETLAPGLASTRDGERAQAKGLAARIELGRGNVAVALPLFREAIALDRASGRDSDAVDDAFALAFALHQRSHRYAEARAVLDEAADKLPSYADGRARAPYYRGILAAETGDRRAALALLRDARAYAEKLGLSRLERNARSSVALQLLELGRAREAADTLKGIEKELATAEGVTPCERAEVKNNLGWAALVMGANEAHGAGIDAVDVLQGAVALHGKGGCADPYTRSFALGNLALAAIETGQLDVARAQLTEARASIAEPRGVEVLFWRDLEGRIALAEHDAGRALASFEAELKLARAAVLGEEEWRALVGRAEALEAGGKVDEAARAYADAEAALDRQSLLVPLGEGRASFLGERMRSARQGVDLLARLHREADAMKMARRSRARVLAGVQAGLRLERLAPAERARWDKAIGDYREARASLDADAANDWKLAADALAQATERRRAREAELKRALEEAIAVLARKAPATSDAEKKIAPGELVLAFHPVRSGWMGFAADPTRTIAAPLGEIPVKAAPEALGTRLLAPFSQALADARKVRVVAFGDLRLVDFHALSLGGKPLVDKIAVEYPLDVRAPAPSNDEPNALVVSDPTQDLPATRGEAKDVAAALSARGWKVAALEGERATSASVVEQLARARLFHFAGHGVYAGREGWESALPLHAGGRLTIADVLASPRVPARVVLSACESARTGEDAPPEGLGLAQAFLAAGSDVVIAPTRRVTDALAAQLARGLYDKLADPNADPADALRAAQASLAQAQPQLDWAAFRVLRP